MDKVKIKLDKVTGKISHGTIIEGADTAVGKILLAAKGKVNIGGREIKIKKPK